LKGQGVCTFYTLPVASGITINKCLLTDYSCAAKCVCSNNWGGVDCSTNSTTLVASTQSRTLLLQKLYNITQTQDISASSVTTWLASLSSLTFRAEEISVDAVQIIQDIIVAILENADDAGVASEYLKPLLDTLNYIYPIVLSESALSAAYPAYSSDTLLTLSQDFITTQTSILQELLQYLMTDSVDGEFQYTDVQGGEIRLNLISKQSFSVSNSTVSTSVAQTALEQAFDAEAFQASFYAITPGAGVKLSLLELQYSSFLTSALELNTHPVLLQLENSDSVCSSGAGECEFEFELFNIESLDYVTSNPNEPINTKCEHDGVYREITYDCAGGLTVTVACEGDYDGYITTNCPYVSTAPECGLLQDYVLMSARCTTTSFTSTSTICSCTISADDFTFSTGRRRMISSSSAGAEISSKTTSTSVGSSSKKMEIVPPPPYSILGVKSKGLWIILAFMIAFILSCIGFYLYYKFILQVGSD